jgi:hypothetical protein
VHAPQPRQRVAEQRQVLRSRLGDHPAGLIEVIGFAVGTQRDVDLDPPASEFVFHQAELCFEHRVHRFSLPVVVTQ